MDSPPSTSLWSEAFILSDDSGLLITSGSISSGSMETHSGYLPFEYQDSDNDKSLSSQIDSLDGMSDIICGEHFNTLKKGPNWLETRAIEPPLEFQDYPPCYETYAENLTYKIVDEALSQSITQCTRNFKLNLHVFRPIHHQIYQRTTYWSPDFLPFSPCHGGRPSSRSSLGSSRLSSSHNSLSVPTAHRADDSSFITQAVSHDTLTTNQISDLYNVPFDSDVYAIPVDTVKPPLKPKRMLQQHKKRRRNTASGFRELERPQASRIERKPLKLCCGDSAPKRHSVAGTSNTDTEPVHMTLQEVRQYLQTLYSSSSDSSETKIERKLKKTHANQLNNNNNNNYSDCVVSNTQQQLNNNIQRKKTTFLNNIKNRKVKNVCDNNINNTKQQQIAAGKEVKRTKKSPAKVFWLKQTLCNMFKFRRVLSPTHHDDTKTNNKLMNKDECDSSIDLLVGGGGNKKIVKRALPPLPAAQLQELNVDDDDSPTFDFATSIRKVKDYGWYWGPLSSEGAEKILSNEPDGSFIVRDSSDDHYIFSLTFKLNNSVRHVRIEHDQGNFSFGSCTKFKSQTIVEFIENAVEHSRSGRYLFFLHRRPTIGPVRVQLLHPVSRFKQTQSLQHMCRFAILKKVRKDLIPSLPLPRRMIDYLSTPHYYSENLIDIDDERDEIVASGGGNGHISEEYGNNEHSLLSDEISALNLRQS